MTARQTRIWQTQETRFWREEPAPRGGFFAPKRGSEPSEDVVTAAGKLFSARGYHGTSMRDLARELGLIGSSLYSHIDSKADLLVEVVERGAVLFQESADEAMATPGDGLTRLRALVAGHVDVVLDHPDEVRTFLYEAHALDQSHRARVLAARDRYEQAFRTVLEAGADGRFAAYRTSIRAWRPSSFSPSSTPSKGGIAPMADCPEMNWSDEILAFGLEGIGP